MNVNSQNGTTFVPVVWWEDVGVELTTGGRHGEGLTKGNLAPRKIVINEIAGRDWTGEASCASESGVTAVRMVRILGENERGNKETEAAYNHDSVSSFRDLPTRKVRGLTQGLIVAAETRLECILMCLMTSATRERTRGYRTAKVRE